MKRSQEQCTSQHKVHTIHIKVMEVTQRLQPIQDKACQLFTEIEVQGAELEEVVTATKKCLEGPINKASIQEFTEQEASTQQQVEASQTKLEDFEAKIPKSE
jgi:hypothetical protein